jgi:hypothetical protein
MRFTTIPSLLVMLTLAAVAPAQQRFPARFNAATQTNNISSNGFTSHEAGVDMLMVKQN